MKVKILRGNYEKVISNNVKVDLIFTSPPYNIGSKSLAKITNRKYGGYDSKSYRSICEYPDNLPEEQYQESQISFLKWAYKHLKPGGICAYNHKPRRKNNILIHPLLWILRVPEFALVEEIIWDRGSTHNHSKKLLWPHYESIYVLRRREDTYKKFINTKEMEYRSNIWRIPKAKVNGHNAPFPFKLAEAVIKAWTAEGDTVMDPYMGSGTVGAACKKLNRNFIGSEKLKKYYNMAKTNIETKDASLYV